MSALDYLQQELDQLKTQGLWRDLRVVSGRQGPRCVINGREVINLSSNNYLGLAGDPRLVRAMTAAAEKYGAGAGAVRTIVGTQDIHVELEWRLAQFKGSEAALVFPSGFACNLGTIPVLVGEGDAILSDALNHASIIDGCRLSKAKIIPYPHNDLDALERLLQEARNSYRRLLVATDGVFSMDGDVAPLPRIAALCERYGAMSYVDDAHGSGVMGEGRGTVHHFGLEGRIDVQIGTLSKAIGVVGGYVAGRRALIEMLQQRARPFLFSTAMPPAVAAACLAALDVLEREPQRVQLLWENARFFKDGLNRLGFDTGRSETPITPVIIGDEALALQFSDRLLEAGVFAQGIAFPTVPRGRARVRTIVTSAHARADLEQALQAFRRLFDAFQGR